MSQSKERPKGVGATALAMVGFNLLGYTFIDWHADRASVVLYSVLASMVIAASLIVVWFYWEGYNWARWLVLLVCVLAIWNLTLVLSLSIYMRSVVVGEAALGVFMLYWLNTRNIRLFFRKPN